MSEAGSPASEAPTPAWGHTTGVLAMQRAISPAQRTEALERSLIVERPSRYCWAYDERRAELLTDCFTEDAVWEGTVAGLQRVGPLSGRERILEWLTEFWPHQRHQPRHVLLNTVIEEHNENEARTLSYLLLSTARRGQVKLSTTGFYRLSLARVGDDWQITHMFAGFDAPFWPGKLEGLGERGRERHGLFDGPAS
jgi:SnoaL-like domain